MPTTQDLHGKTALVTGATAFIGRAVAIELARRGARVVVNGRNPDSGPVVIEEIAAAGGQAEFEATDLTDRAAVHAMVERIVQRHGKIVAIGTDAGRVATVGESFIGGATGGMMQMCRVLARELGRDGIRINAVAMSYIWDAEPRWGGGSAALAGAHGQGMIDNLRKRMLFPVHCKDIAQAAAFFAGPESDAITGQTLSVNGGLSTPG